MVPTAFPTPTARSRPTNADGSLDIQSGHRGTRSRRRRVEIGRYRRDSFFLFADTGGASDLYGHDLATLARERRRYADDPAYTRLLMTAIRRRLFALLDRLQEQRWPIPHESAIESLRLAWYAEAHLWQAQVIDQALYRGAFAPAVAPETRAP